MAIRRSTLLFAKLPLFEALLAGSLALWDGGIATLRILTATLGLVSVGLLHLVVRRTARDTALALLAALALALHPQAVLYSRMGFSYNLLAPLALLTYLGAWQYLGTGRRRWLALAALSLGSGALSDLWAFVLLPPLTLTVSARRTRDLAWSLPLALLPFALYAALAARRAPQAFLFDLRFTLSRLGGASLPAQARTLALNYATLLSDGWFALALIGFFVTPCARSRTLGLAFLLLPIAALGRTEALFGLSAYYTIPLLPLVALGLGALLRYGTPKAVNATRRGLERLLAAWGWPGAPGWTARWGAGLLVAALVATPLATAAARGVEQARHGYQTAIDPFLLDPEDARRAADFVNRRTEPEDLVIASPGLAWLLDARVADFQMSGAAAGRASPHLPADLPAARFAYDPRYTGARFVVVDNLWRNWAVWHVPEAAEIVAAVEERWPLAFQAGAVAVYANPAPLTEAESKESHL
jgi:hypothetical protein